MKRDATRTENKIMKALEEELFGASEETENELAAAVEPLEKWLEQLLLNNIMNNVSDLGTLTNCGI